MSWSLEITNGDLSFAGTGMGTVEGASKLVQDLRCGILEPMGIDDMHPTYGTVLDGGTLPDGTYQPGIIGEANNQYAASFVSSEIQRVASNLQQAQVTRNHDDLTTYGRSTLTPDETLVSLGDIAINTAQNQMLVAVDLETGAGSTSISIPTS